MEKTFRTFATTADASSREDVFDGKDYLVIPVIAMIEGVRFGGNQESPELGLVSEFGKFPAGWDTTPVVMDHPQVDGIFVSAGNVAIREQSEIGFLANTIVDGKKLKTEAWLDISKKDLSADVTRVFERVESGEMVEVSVGIFQMLESTTGVFESTDVNGNIKSQEFGGIWRNIVPDHLAILPEGTLGACSIEDGCGGLRDQQKQDNMTVQCKKCSQEPDVNASKTDKEMKAYTEHVLERFQVQYAAANNIDIKTQAVADGVTYNDARSIIADLLNTRHTYWVYIAAMTNEHVIYETWDQQSDTYKSYRLTYDVGADLTVTLGDTSEEVLLTTTITSINEGIVTMSKDEPAVETPAETPAEAPATPAVENNVVAETPAEAAPVAQTAQQYIDNAPAEIREVLAQGMKLQTEKRDAAVTKITAQATNKFSEEFLRAQSMETLDNLVALLPTEATPTGQSAPVSPRVTPQSVQTPADNATTMPLPVSCFAKKDTK